MEVKAKYGIIPVYSSTLNLCDLTKEIDDPCPIKEGSMTQTVSEAIPSFVPGVSQSA